LLLYGRSGLRLPNPTGDHVPSGTAANEKALPDPGSARTSIIGLTQKATRPPVSPLSDGSANDSNAPAPGSAGVPAGDRALRAGHSAVPRWRRPTCPRWISAHALRRLSWSDASRLPLRTTPEMVTNPSSRQSVPAATVFRKAATLERDAAARSSRFSVWHGTAIPLWRPRAAHRPAGSTGARSNNLWMTGAAQEPSLEP